MVFHIQGPDDYLKENKWERERETYMWDMDKGNTSR